MAGPKEEEIVGSPAKPDFAVSGKLAAETNTYKVREWACPIVGVASITPCLRAGRGDQLQRT